jgi:hypothetical protein
MIVGHGDIASVLPIRDDLLFFASGVSNSQETDESEYRREAALLARQDRTKRLVYFSSLSVFFSESRYADHKRTIEATIKKFVPRYCIMRLGNIDWGTNPHTLINYLKAHPEAEIKNEYRFVIDQDEFLMWVNAIPPWNCEMNCPGRRLLVKEIYDEYCTS